jgi:hypothetical protein
MSAVYPTSHRAGWAIAGAMALVLVAYEARAAEDCSAQLAAVVAQTYPDAEKVSDLEFSSKDRKLFLPGYESERYAAVCRIWPADPNRLLVAVPLIVDEAASVVAGDIDILVVDSSTLQVKQRLLLENAIEDDAFKIRSIGIDTARYTLTPTMRAFGVRVEKVGSSSVNPFSETSLSLYAIDAYALRQVLAGIVVEKEQGEFDGNCVGTSKTTTRTLAMDDKRIKGFATIRVTEATLSSTYAADDTANCREQTKKLPSRTLGLIFDGNRYAVPDEFRPL